MASRAFCFLHLALGATRYRIDAQAEVAGID